MNRDARRDFQAALNSAIAAGTRPTSDSGLSKRTRAAVDDVATAHPDASADDIAYACDVFDGDHCEHKLTGT